jgi:uncharacterized protein (TIGR02594 family)
MPTYLVTAQSLNLRAEPSLQGQILGTLQKGEEVSFEQASDDKYWYHVKCNDGQTGWVSSKYLAARADPALTAGSEEFPWMPVALGELGVKEAPGAANNPRVVEYLRSTSLDAQLASSDETPWCSAFVNWCVEKSGYAGTDSAWARSWLGWGQRLDAPRRGCITVFSREPDAGHVAFFLQEAGDYVEVLGGNQHDSVCVTRYPKNRLLGYRAP